MALLLALIAVNVVVSLLGFRAFGGQGDVRPEEFLFIPHEAAEGRNARGMLLSHFAHADIVHLGLNMWALYSFAQPVLDTVGPVWFFAIYAVAGLGADLTIFAIRYRDPLYRCLGASGSVFGVMAAAVVIDPNMSILFLFVPVPVPGPVFMVGYVIFSVLVISRGKRVGVSHEGHLGGAILGLALAGLVAPRGLQPLLRWFSQWL